MRITAIRDTVAPISSQIANAYIDFSKMTASVVAIHSDLVRDGRKLVGFGFNSNGRYAVQGLLRERFIPRLAEADPAALVDEGGLIDPARAWAVMMQNEKPGGHGERSVAVGVLDMALWDLRAKAEGVPLWRLLADRYGGGEADPHAWVYAAGGYYYPGKDIAALQDEIRHYRDLGYACVKIKIGGVPLAEDLKRIEAVLGVVGSGDNLAVDANGRFSLDEAIAYADALAPYGLRWYEEPLDPLDYAAHAILAERYAPPLATGENLFSVHDSRNLIRHGRAAVRSGAVLRPRRIPAHPRHARAARLDLAALRAAWRPPVRTQHRGRIGARRQRELSRRLRAVRRLRRRLPGRKLARPPPRPPRHRLRGEIGALPRHAPARRGLVTAGLPRSGRVRVYIAVRLYFSRRCDP
jgi:L-alanine-DL-glutamate epimerase-like enolase superfamily enzyme